MVAVTDALPSGLRFAAVPDVMPIYEAEALARALAAFTPTDEAESLLARTAAEARAGQDFTDTLGIYDLRTWNPVPRWNDLAPADRLRAPIGRTPNGQVVYLDIKEGAENGTGPHGMMTGMTGSGKTEHLRAWVLALAATHSPQQLRILLGDFKGQAGLGGLERLPHCDAIVSNLENSRHKLERFKLVLRGELMRRQELLNAKKFKDVREYERARKAGRTDLEPVGVLLLVLDEFSQLLDIAPEMKDVMDEVARLGRSLWIHIINASQRVEVGKMQGMIAQQTYAIGLKLKDAGESRAAIGTPHAWQELKRAPQGSAFLVIDGELTRYRSFYASGQYIAPKVNAAERDRAEGHYLPVTPFTSAVAALPDTVGHDAELEEDSALDDNLDADAPTVAELMVERMAEAARTVPRGHQMWLPALDETSALTLDVVVSEFWKRPWDVLTEDSGLIAPYGREDDPYAHTQDVIAANLGDSHGGVAGAPQTGKSTALRTLMMSLALANSPQRVQFYGIDFGGLKMHSVAALPHVCGIAGAGDEEKIQRVVSEVERIVRNRRRDWARWVDPMARDGHSGLNLLSFRAHKFGPNRRPVPEDEHGDVFLVVDNMAALKTEMLAIHDRINALIQGSLNFGVHVILANDTWMDLRVESKLETKVELRLADNADSKMDRMAAKHVPPQKGRGLVKSSNEMLVAVPYVAQFAELDTEVAATAATAELVAHKWLQSGFGRAPQLQQLPASVAFADLDPLPPTAPRHGLRIGIGERDMSTAWLDLDLYPHAYCTGTTKSGRTAFLRTVCAAIMETYTPQEAQVIMFDPEFSIGDAVSKQYRGVWHTEHEKIAGAAQQLAKALEGRRPPADLEPEELQNWKPQRVKLFIVVDDLTLLSPGGPTMTLLAPLVAAAETARRLDLHIIAALASDNWYGRGKANKLIQAMDRGGASVVILDGDRTEMIIDGVRPASRIPGRAELYIRKGGGQLIQVAQPPDLQAAPGPAA